LSSDERLDYYIKKYDIDEFAAEEACKFIATDAEERGDYELAERFKQRAKELHKEGLLKVPPIFIRSEEEPRFKRDKFP
jgi:hypothetical protein